MRTRAATQPTRPRLHEALRVLREGGQIPLVSSHGRGWNGIAADRYFSHMREVHQPPLNEHFLSIALSPLRLTQVLEGRTESVDKGRGDVGLCPSGVETDWHFSNPYDVLLVRLRPDFLRQVAAETDGLHPDRTELVNRLHHPDGLTTHLSMALLNELASDCPGGRLYADSFANILAVHLLEHYGARPRTPRACRGGLTKARLYRAFAYIHANLESDLGLADVAREAQLSTYHFARLFKQATGLAPHQYVIRQRVARAKELLLSGKPPPLAQVASRAGFVDLSHLTRHCKQLLGVTPGRLRGGKEKPEK